MASSRPFPYAAIVLFPIAGPPALALAGACIYAAFLMILLLSPTAIVAIPLYFTFWTSKLYGALGLAAFAAGILYVVAVRLFAPPTVRTALVAGFISGAGYWLLWLTGAPGQTISSDNAIVSFVLAAVVCSVQVLPGWWLTQKTHRLFDRRRAAD